MTLEKVQECLNGKFAVSADCAVLEVGCLVSKAGVRRPEDIIRVQLPSDDFERLCDEGLNIVSIQNTLAKQSSMLVHLSADAGGYLRVDDARDSVGAVVPAVE